MLGVVDSCTDYLLITLTKLMLKKLKDEQQIYGNGSPPVFSSPVVTPVPFATVRFWSYGWVTKRREKLKKKDH
jgi:hypothetical protein